MYCFSFHGFILFDPKGNGMVANASHYVETEGVNLIGASGGYGSGVDHASPNISSDKHVKHGIGLNYSFNYFIIWMVPGLYLLVLCLKSQLCYWFFFIIFVWFFFYNDSSWLEYHCTFQYKFC